MSTSVVEMAVIMGVKMNVQRTVEMTVQMTVKMTVSELSQRDLNYNLSRSKVS